MHIIKPYETAVSLFGQDGSVRLYSSLSEALRVLGESWIGHNVGRNFVEFSHVAHLQGDRPTREVVYTGSSFVMRNDFGESLTLADFAPLIVRRRHYWGRFGRLLANWNGDGPVPGTGRHHNGHYYRRVRTTNERRWAEPIREEGEPAPRGARNINNLPECWDDYPVSARRDRNWKRHRKQQWISNNK